jgi:hypothetical protein
MPRYGIRCVVDAHQGPLFICDLELMSFSLTFSPTDVYSRLTGGSGAPAWTLALAGLNLRSFKATGAAHLHNLNLAPDDPPASVWPSGYQKLAAATMNTLFWAGDVFAWKKTVPASRHRFASDIFGSEEGEVNVGTFLRLSMIEAFGRLADRLRDCEAVVGFEVDVPFLLEAIYSCWSKDAHPSTRSR